MIPWPSVTPPRGRGRSESDSVLAAIFKLGHTASLGGVFYCHQGGSGCHSPAELAKILMRLGVCRHRLPIIIRPIVHWQFQVTRPELLAFALSLLRLFRFMLA